MRILVTGGAGFVGSAVCRMLIGDATDHVINVDKLTYAASPDSVAEISASSRYSFHQVDICDRPAVDRILATEEPNAVLHFAAESHVDRSITSPSAFIVTNVLGTFTLLDATRAYWARLPASERGAFRFLHASTDEVYGSLGPTGSFTEKTAYNPSSPYAASKAASDHIAHSYWRTYDLPVIVSNSSNNYGPFQFPEKFIPLMITNAILGKALPIYGNGANIRDWLHVDDHAAAILAMLKRGRPGETYNVGSRSERSNLTVVEAICDLLDQFDPPLRGSSYRELIEFVEDRPGHDFRYATDSTKIESELGWEATETFETGLAKTVEWYLENEGWWRALRRKVYDGERLGRLG